MKRRYDMRRSDNFPVCAVVERLCMGKRGRIFVFTGFPVKSAIVAPVRTPPGSELLADTKFDQLDGFFVLYDGMPDEPSVVKFSYQVS